MLASIYGSIRFFGEAIKLYDETITIAHRQGDRTLEFIAIVRKLTFLLVILHIDSWLDYTKERDSTLQSLVTLIGHQSYEEFKTQLITNERLKLESQNANKERIKETIKKLEEAIPNLEIILALKNGDMKAAEDCIQRVKDAELALYGANSPVEMIMDFYLLLFNSPDRDMNEEPQLSEDPEYVPDIYNDKSLVDNFRMLLEWITNCTLNNWHKSAEDSAAVLLGLAIKAGSDYHICIAIYMNARYLGHTGQVQDALEEYSKAVSILDFSKNASDSDADLSPYLYYAIHMSMGDLLVETSPNDAIQHFDKALEYVAMENSNHQLLDVDIRISRAVALVNSGLINEAEEEFIVLLEKLCSYAIGHLPYLTGDEREMMWNNIQRSMKTIVSQLNCNSSNAFKLAAYNAVLFSKGFLFTSEKTIQQIVEEVGQEEALSLYSLSIKENIFIGAWGEHHSYDANQYVDKYLNDIKLQLLIKDALTEASVNILDDYSSILANLKPGEAIVDFFDTYVNYHNRDNKYIAFITKCGSEYPEVVETVSESFLSGLMEALRETGQGDFVLYDSDEEYGRNLLDNLWGPIEPLLNDCTTIFFSPSGSLHKIALESLPTSKGILAQQYKGFHRISHAREVTSFYEEKKAGKNDAIIIGGLQYDDTDDSLTGNSIETRGYALNKHQGYDNDSDEPSPWPFLSWSEREVDSIEQIFTLSMQFEWKKYKGLSGDNGVLLGLSDGGPRLMHIATHGFCETVQSAKIIPALNGLHLPLDLTGLIFSFGNVGWLSGDKMNHIGVLTATEIANLNLSNTELVVLSSCFTGSGFIRQDGLYGLIRAFKKAGVKTILASLWEVDDAAAFSFMYGFYMAYLIYKQQYRDAFEYARQRTKEQYPNPMFWAGYVLLD